MDSLPGQLPNDDYYSQYGIDEGNGHVGGMTVFDSMGIDDTAMNGLDDLNGVDSIDSHFLMDSHMTSSKPATSPTPYTAGLPTPISVSATPEATTAPVDAPPLPAGFPPSFLENGKHSQNQNSGQNDQHGDNSQGKSDPAHTRNAQHTAMPFQQHPQHPHPLHHEQQQQQQQQQRMPAHLLQNLPPAFANNPHAQALLQQNPELLYQLVQMQQAIGPHGVHGQSGESGQNGQNGSHAHPPSTHRPSDHANVNPVAERFQNGNAPHSSSGSPSLRPTTTSASPANTWTNIASSTSNASHANTTNTTNTVSPNTATAATASSSTAATATTPDDLRLQDLSIVPATQSTSSRPGPDPLTSSASTATIIGPQPTASSTTSRPPGPSGPPPGPPQSSHPPHPYMNHPPPPHYNTSRSASSPIHNSSHSHTHSAPPVPALPPQHLLHYQHLQQQIPLPPAPHTSSSHTISPKKQRAPSASASHSTSPKKPGRFENIYATIRKATTMRRSRAAFMNEAPAPTVAPMALMRDADNNTQNNSSSNNNRNNTLMPNSKAHAHFRSHHPGDLDLDLSLNANGFPMTPPLTGNGSSLSSTSSTFSTSSACSSLASSFDAQNQMHSHPLMMQPTPIHFGVNQCVNAGDDLSAADLASFGMSGLVVDDPFVDSNAFFGGGQPAIKADPSANNAVSSACWTESTAALAATPMSSTDDNESTPVSNAATAAINIPSSRGMVSPTACLADATAAMSGNSLIAAANAAATLKCESGAMETDEDWWQQSVVESAVGDAHGLPYYGDNNAMFLQQDIQQNMQNMPGMNVNCAPDGSFYPMPDMATQGLMIHMPPSGESQQQQQQQQQNQYYFPNVTTVGNFGSVSMMATHSAPQYSMQPQQPEIEFRRDRVSNTPRRPKPRAPSAGARHLQPGGGSPRKRLGLTSRGPSNEDLNSAYICSNGSGNAAAMTTPNTPRSHANGARRSVSMQSLPRTSPTPNNSSMPLVPPMPSTPSHNQNGVRKRRSASSMRRVSSGQSCGSMSGAPRTPTRRASAEPSRPQSSSGAGAGTGFVNFTPDDKYKLMAGVAPSGSSKTKERRDRELKEKTRKLMEAVVQAGGDMHTLEAQGLKQMGIKI